MKRFFILVLALLTLVVMLVSCGSTNTADTTKKVDFSKMTFVHITKNLTNPTFITIADGIKAACAKYGVGKVDIQAPLTKDSNEEQINLIQDAIAKKVDAILLIPTDSTGIVPAVEQAYKAGIPVININTSIGKGDYQIVTYVVADNYSAANTVTTKFCEMLGSGEIFLLTGVPGASSAVELEAGARDAISKFPNIKIVAAQTANYQRAQAFEVTQNLLQAYPNVKGIVANNDEMALGAIEALSAAGLAGKVLVCGIDGNSDALKAMQNGFLKVTANKSNYEQGYVGAEAACKFLLGEKVDPKYPLPAKLITMDNIKDWIK